MFSKLLKKPRQLANKGSGKLAQHLENPKEQMCFSTNLDTNVTKFRELFNNCFDIVVREFLLGTEKPIKAALIYCSVLSDHNVLSENILKPLMLEIQYTNDCDGIIDGSIMDNIKNQVVSVGEIKEIEEVPTGVNFILNGSALLFVDGHSKGLTIKIKGGKERAITEAESETVVRGPRDGFTETLDTNLVLLRRRLVSSRLKTENITIGALSNTKVLIVYIEGIANEKVVEEVRRRLKRIETDSIIESGQIEEFIKDAPYSPFPQVIATERPDKVAGFLMEGHIAVVVDNTPFVLLMPVTFYQFMQAAEDYYNNFIFATAIRLLRFVTLNVALLLPALYIAVTTYHQEMLPTDLLISIASAREGVPFPALVEALMMEFTFEILREAGVRLPRPVGQAVSIVGALVIGEAAVTAGLVSPAMVIVVSLTAIASFTIPSASGGYPIRLLRFPMMIMAGILGLFGIMVGLMAILVHLCALRSFGIPYLAPLAPTIWGDLKDVFVRVPWFKMKQRPKLVGQQEKYRQDPKLIPAPPEQPD